MTMGCVLCSMSSVSNSWISEAWMAAPRTASSDGLIAVGDVEGARTTVLSGNAERTAEATLGVCEFPPARMISETSRGSRLAFSTACVTRRVNAAKSLLPSRSYRVRLMVEVKSTPPIRLSTEKFALLPMDNDFLTASLSSFSLDMARSFSRGSPADLCFLMNSLAKWSIRTWSSLKPLTS